MNNYQSMAQNDVYNPNQPVYQAESLSYELPKNMMSAYSSSSDSCCEGGALSAPTISMLP